MEGNDNDNNPQKVLKLLFFAFEPYVSVELAVILQELLISVTPF